MKTLRTILEIWEHPFSGKDDPNHFTLVHNELSKHYTLPSGSSESKALISAYTASSDHINNHLYNTHVGNGKLTAMSPENAQSFSDQFQSVVSSHRAPRDFHVYSGSRISPAEHNDPTKSHIKVHLPAFTSTSLNPKVAGKFARLSNHDSDAWTNAYKANEPISHIRANLFKIHVPAGSRGMYVAKYSGIAAEKEFIIPHGAKLHIHPEPEPREIEISPGNERSVNVWHAKLVHDGTEPTRHADEET